MSAPEWQVALLRDDDPDQPVTDPAEIREALYALFPGECVAFDYYDETTDLLITLPIEHANQLQFGGYLDLQTGRYRLVGEMP